MVSLKKLTAVSAAFVLVLFQASCLRDADDGRQTQQDGAYTQGTEHMIEQNTESSAHTTEEVTSEPETLISEAAQMWIDTHTEPDTVILTQDEIEAENLRMDAESDTITDILELKAAYTADELICEIERCGKPPSVGYDKDGGLIPDEHREGVMDNRALDLVSAENKTRRGIVTSRANMRAFPDDKPYRKAPDDPYDSIQQTELHVGTPVWVLHESRDGSYSFVRSYNYAGWVESADIAVTEDDALWRSFAAPEEFVCITSASVKLRGEEADMGVVLPLTGEKNGKYEVYFPKRSGSGELKRQTVNVDITDASVGYLPYTYSNFLTQAFKYEGVMYSWGGLDSGVDCSGFISNVMRTFGFMLPRDTKDQEGVVGSAVDVTGKSHGELAQALAAVSAPTAVYYKGHVLFYLGYKADEGNYYFIHAPQIGEAVSVTTKADLSGMRYICEIG